MLIVLAQLARDLIPRMLVVDPMKRITIPEIRRHPWFTTKLPLYLSHPPFKIDKEVRNSGQSLEDCGPVLGAAVSRVGGRTTQVLERF